MIKTNLSSGEIQDLLNRYNSELKKLEFQTAEVKMTVLGLENLMNDVKSKEKASFTKVKIKKTSTTEKPTVKLGRKSLAKKIKKDKKKVSVVTKPKKVKLKKAGTAKPNKASIKKKAVTKPKKVTTKVKTAGVEKKGYKLSDWDNFVIQSIEQSGKVLITSEIIDQVKNKMMAAGKKTNDKEIKNKITRSLQKLVNRRGDLSKVSFKGKGFAYALPKWLISKGKVAPEFNR
jgi:hypothetical protein